MKGVYLLPLQIDESQPISIGRLGVQYFTMDFYAYVGSALNGLETRVNRHLNRKKKYFWHIDYLPDKACIYEVVLIPTEEKLAYTLAMALKEKLVCISRFGSSDCHCPGHLFFTTERKDLDKQVTTALANLGCAYYRHSITHADTHAIHQVMNR